MAADPALLDTRGQSESDTVPVVQLDNVEIVYDKHFLAVQGISLEAHRGDVIALLGPNGAGKSTVLKMISGIGRSERGEVTRGRVLYDGEDVTNARAKTMVDRGVTHVLEERRVFEDLTVEENLRCGLYRSGRRFGFDRTDYELAFEYFPALEDLLDINAGYASGGEQQMLVIARALLSLTETGEEEGPRTVSMAVTRPEEDDAEARADLPPGGTAELAADGFALDVTLDDDAILSGAVGTDGAVGADEAVVEIELSRPAGQPFRRRFRFDDLARGTERRFEYETTAPKLLLLDEPSLGLAPQLVNDIFEKLVEINRLEGITMLIADQNARKTLEIADYGYVMENGQIELNDPADVLMDREEIKEYYLGTSQGGDRYTDIKHYKIRKRYD